jgi:hypothetical protein
MYFNKLNSIKKDRRKNSFVLCSIKIGFFDPVYKAFVCEYFVLVAEKGICKQ